MTEGPADKTYRWLDDDDRLWYVPIGMTTTNTGRCRSCKQVILWVVTAGGKKMPLNSDGTSHFATCPDADKFRRRGRAPEEPDWLKDLPWHS